MKVTPLQQTTPSLRTSPSLVVVTSSSLLEKMAAYFTRWFVVRRPTITKGFLVLLILSVTSLIFLSYYVTSFNSPLHVPPHPTLQCRVRDADYSNSINNHVSPAQQLRIDNRVLILAETLYTAFGQDLVVILEANRISYKMALAGKSLPSLTHADKGKFGVIIFERLESYLNMDNWNRQLLDKYCRDYNVGIIAFAHPDEALYNAQVRDFPLFVHTKLSLQNYEVNPSSPILRVTRASEVAHGILPSDEWTVFVGNHSTYEPLSWARMSTNGGDTGGIHSMGDLLEEIRYIPVMHDRGLFDGIQRMLFGNGLNFWLHKLLFLDTLSYLSHGKLSISLDRYILIDVDDIFVSRPGTRMKRDDVEVIAHLIMLVFIVEKGFLGLSEMSHDLEIDVMLFCFCGSLRNGQRRFINCCYCLLLILLMYLLFITLNYICCPRFMHTLSCTSSLIERKQGHLFDVLNFFVFCPFTLSVIFTSFVKVIVPLW